MNHDRNTHAPCSHDHFRQEVGIKRLGLKIMLFEENSRISMSHLLDDKVGPTCRLQQQALISRHAAAAQNAAQVDAGRKVSKRACLAVLQIQASQGCASSQGADVCTMPERTRQRTEFV